MDDAARSRVDQQLATLRGREERWHSDAKTKVGSLEPVRGAIVAEFKRYLDARQTAVLVLDEDEANRAVSRATQALETLERLTAVPQ